jgi:hypothetical protein
MAIILYCLGNHDKGESLYMFSWDETFFLNIFDLSLVQSTDTKVWLYMHACVYVYVNLFVIGFTCL